jgi:tetratricopeptide (TPR) repeat protein
MELVKGVPITDYCDQHRLTPRERLELFVPICQAVQHAHQKGIIHRDLKPSNVLIAHYDGKPVPKVIDFGVAKATGPKLTEQTLFTHYGSIVGTFEYMSPEQAELNQLDVDTRSDIYSLGVLLYELLTGTTPLERRRVRESALWDVLRLIREEEPARPSTRLSSTTVELPSIAVNRGLEPRKLSVVVRGELDWIVMKALEKDRSRRYETANGLARDIQRYLSDETVEACPPSTRYRLWKFTRRYRKALVTATAFLALLAGGTVVSTWQAMRAMRAEALALANERRSRTAAAAAKMATESEAAQRRQAEAVAGLLESVFAGMDPMQRELDVKDQLVGRLDAVAADLDTEFAGEPLVRARLRHALGITLSGLGEYPKAAMLLEQALAGRRRHLGPDHPDTLESLSQLAYAYHAVGQVDRASPLFEEALERRRAVLGPDHLDTLASLHNLAYGYHATGRLDEALPLYEQALERRKASLGAHHPATLHSMNNLAMAYRAAGRLDEALALLEQAFEQWKVHLGPGHNSTLTTMDNLACTYRDTGQPGKALPLLEQASENLKARFGPDHPRTLSALVHLALAYQATGRRNEALRLLEQTVEKQTAKLGPGHPTTLSTFNHLAQAYEAGGQPERAESLVRELLACQRQTANPESVAIALSTLGRILSKQARHAEAELLLRECLARRARQCPEDWTKFHTQSLLGRTLLGQKKYAEAEPFLIQGYQGMRQRQARIPVLFRTPYLIEGLESLVQLFTAWGKPNEAAPWREELEALSSPSQLANGEQPM